MAAFEFIVPLKKEREKLKRSSGLTLAQKGSLEEFNGPIEMSRGKVDCRLQNKGLSCSSLSWLKGERGINPGCGCRAVGKSWGLEKGVTFPEKEQRL